MVRAIEFAQVGFAFSLVVVLVADGCSLGFTGRASGSFAPDPTVNTPLEKEVFRVGFFITWHGDLWGSGVVGRGYPNKKGVGGEAAIFSIVGLGWLIFAKKYPFNRFWKIIADSQEMPFYPFGVLFSKQETL